MTKPDDTIRVLIPLTVRKKNGRPKILPPADYRPSEDQAQDPHILRAIGRAWGWRRRMEAGEFATIQELAEAVGLDRGVAVPMMAAGASGVSTPRAFELLEAAPDGVGGLGRDLLAGDDAGEGLRAVVSRGLDRDLLSDPDPHAGCLFGLPNGAGRLARDGRHPPSRDVAADASLSG